MSKFREWLTPAANLAVVASMVFLAIQMRNNTRAIEAQTRDSITEKAVATVQSCSEMLHCRSLRWLRNVLSNHRM